MRMAAANHNLPVTPGLDPVVPMDGRVTPRHDGA